MDVRLWLMNTELTLYQPLYGDLWFGMNCYSCHEWWTKDGKFQWVDYEDGIYKTEVGEGRTREVIWPHQGLCHGQVDPTNQYLIGDQWPYHRNENKPCEVYLYDRKAKREILINSHLPNPDTVAMRDNRAYHLDPHPCFSLDGNLFTYTCTSKNDVDVAVGITGDVLQNC